jgi:hypothetical protein
MFNCRSNKYPISEFQTRLDSGKVRNDCRLCLNAYHRKLYLEKVGKFKREVRAETREADPKRCIKCGVLKPLSEFTFHNRNKGQHRNFCHECEKKWISQYHKTPQGKGKRKEWVEQNRAKIEAYKQIYKTDPVRRAKSKAYQRGRWLRENFNMSVDDDMVLYERQDGKCAICKSTEASNNGRRKNFCVDHDHETGKVRGLLCHNCNVSVGLMKESPELFRRAAAYLESLSPKTPRSRSASPYRGAVLRPL